MRRPRRRPPGLPRPLWTTATEPAIALSHRATHLFEALSKRDPEAVRAAQVEVDALQRTYSTMDVTPLVEAVGHLGQAAGVGRPPRPGAGGAPGGGSMGSRPSQPAWQPDRADAATGAARMALEFPRPSPPHASANRATLPALALAIAAPGDAAAECHAAALGLGPHHGAALPPRPPASLGGTASAQGHRSGAGRVGRGLDPGRSGAPGPGPFGGGAALADPAGPFPPAFRSEDHGLHHAVPADSSHPGRHGAPGSPGTQAQHSDPPTSAHGPAQFRPPRCGFSPLRTRPSSRGGNSFRTSNGRRPKGPSRPGGPPSGSSRGA